METIKFGKNDPVNNCTLYKSIGCSHVDSYLCDFSECSMYKEHWSSIERYYKIKDILKICLKKGYKHLKNN